MRNIWLILRREYLVRVRSKAFVLFTVLLPLLMGAAVLLPTKLAIHSSSTRRVTIVSSDATLAAAVRGELEEMRMSEDEDPSRKLKSTPSPDAKSKKPAFVVSVENTPNDALKERLTAELRDNKLDGFLWIAPDAMTSRKAVYYSRNGSDFVEASQVSRGLRFALSEQQLSARGVGTAEAKKLLGPVDVDTVKVDKSGSNKSNGMGAFFLPFALLMMIYVTVLTYGLYVMRSVIEEKSSRVVEVLLGSVTPFELMAGKILGVAAVGLTQISIWMVAATAMGAGAMAMVGDLMKDAHLDPAVKFLFSGVLPAGLLDLRLPVCGYWSCGEQRRRGSAVAVPGDDSADCVHGGGHLGHPRSQHIDGLLVLDVSADLADHHVCAGHGEHASGVADSGEHCPQPGDLVRAGVADLAHLSRGDFDVRQAAHAAGDIEVD